MLIPADAPRRRRSYTPFRKTAAAVGATVMQWVSRAYAQQIPCPINSYYATALGGATQNAQSCEIETGGDFVDFGTFSNTGSLFVAGRLENFFYGMTNGFGGLVSLQSTGTFFNEAGGLFSNEDRLSSLGEITNRGTLSTTGTLTNRGTFINNGFLNQTAGNVDNYSLIQNLDDANGTGELYFGDGGSVTNFGTIENQSETVFAGFGINQGTITNTGEVEFYASSLFGNGLDGVFTHGVSPVATRNDGAFRNYGELRVESQPGLENYGTIVNRPTGSVFLEGGRLYNTMGGSFTNEGGYLYVGSGSFLENGFNQSAGNTLVTGRVERQDGEAPVVFSGGGLYGGLRANDGTFRGSIRNVEIQDGTLVSPGRPGLPEQPDEDGRLESIGTLAFDGRLRIDLGDGSGADLVNDVLEAEQIDFGPNALVEFNKEGALGPVSIGDKFTFLETDQLTGLNNATFAFTGYEIQINTLSDNGTTQLELEVVPEPALGTGLLGGVAATGLLAGRRRRRLGREA